MSRSSVNPKRDGKRARIIDRRTFLHGAGVTMALPWLESLAGFGTVGSSAAGATVAAAVHETTGRYVHG